DESTRLRDERDAAGARADVGKARVEPNAGNDQSDAVRPEDTQRVAPRRLQQRGSERPSVGGGSLEARTQHHGRARTKRAELGDEGGNGHGGGGDEGGGRGRGGAPGRGGGAPGRDP